jgi:hypothetical protein
VSGNGKKLISLTFLEKFIFQKSVAPVHSVRKATEVFMLYFDYIMGIIVTETNVYAATFI